MNSKKPAVEAELGKLQRETFGYFLHETNPANGLVVDKTAPNWPASIAATGLALACYPVSVERGFMSRAAAVERTLATLRFFWNSPQGPEPDATGYQGFYYHFLDMQTGRRAWQCELSTVDSAFLLAGALTAGIYFDGSTADESEIRTLGDALYRRANWQWAQNRGATVTHGWKPESGFLKYRWEGYDEALLLYILGLGSPTHPLPEHFLWPTKLNNAMLLHGGVSPCLLIYDLDNRISAEVRRLLNSYTRIDHSWVTFDAHHQTADGDAILETSSYSKV